MPEFECRELSRGWVKTKFKAKFGRFTTNRDKGREKIARKSVHICRVSTLHHSDIHYSRLLHDTYRPVGELHLCEDELGSEGGSVCHFFGGWDGP